MTSGASKKPTRRGRKDSKPVDSPWMDAHRGAVYADEEYRTFLERLKSGEIRCIRVGRKFKTRKDWIDEYFFGLEETGMLERR